MDKITVLCGKVGWKWPEVWVHRLKAMVEANCSVEHEFICVSDTAIQGINTWPASPLKLDQYRPEGWFVKLDYFKPDGVTYGIENPIIALDLDVTLVGDIAELISGRLAGCNDPRTQDPKFPNKYLNSSVLAWTPHADAHAIWTPTPPYGVRKSGDQEYIASVYPDWAELDGCYSYKGHLDGGALPPPEDAIVVYFHGKPTPADRKVRAHAWNAETWGDLHIDDRYYNPVQIKTRP